jgi:hypothetical protein
LPKLIVREKAGQCSKGVYLISPTAKEPEMYELNCASIKQQKSLIENLRYAIAMSNATPTIDVQMQHPFWLDSASSACVPSVLPIRSVGDLARRALHRAPQPADLLAELQLRDRQLAAVCEEKMRLLGELLELLQPTGNGAATAGTANPTGSVAVGSLLDALDSLNYTVLMEQPLTANDLLTQAANEAFRIAHHMFAAGVPLSRSVSSAGEHQSDQFAAPLLPKRAETFAGFDHNAPLPQRSTSVKVTPASSELSCACVHRSSQQSITSDLSVGSLMSTVSHSSGSTGRSQATAVIHPALSSLSSGCARHSSVNVNSALSDSIRIRFQEPSGAEFTETHDGDTLQARTLVPGAPFALSVENLSTEDTASEVPTSVTGPPIQSTSTLSTLEPGKFSTTVLLQAGPSQISTNSVQPNEHWLTQVLQLQHQLNVMLLLYNQLQSTCELLRVRVRSMDLDSASMGTTHSWVGSTGSAGTCAGTGTSVSSSSTVSNVSRHVFRADQQLEELRNLQAEFCAEKQRWNAQVAEQQAQLTDEKQELQKQQNQIQLERTDLIEQREQLYRKLEVLQKQMGICLVNNGNNNYQLTGGANWSPGSTVALTPNSLAAKATTQSTTPTATYSVSMSTSTAGPSVAAAVAALTPSTSLTQQFPLRLASTTSGFETMPKQHRRIQSCKSSPSFPQSSLSAARARALCINESGNVSPGLANRWPPPSSRSSASSAQHSRSGSSPAEVSASSDDSRHSQSSLFSSLHRYHQQKPHDSASVSSLPTGSECNLTGSTSSFAASNTCIAKDSSSDTTNDELIDKEIFC